MQYVKLKNDIIGRICAVEAPARHIAHALLLYAVAVRTGVALNEINVHGRYLISRRCFHEGLAVLVRAGVLMREYRTSPRRYARDRWIEGGPNFIRLPAAALTDEVDCNRSSLVALLCRILVSMRAQPLETHARAIGVKSLATRAKVLAAAQKCAPEITTDGSPSSRRLLVARSSDLFNFDHIKNDHVKNDHTQNRWSKDNLSEQGDRPRADRAGYTATRGTHRAKHAAPPSKRFSRLTPWREAEVVNDNFILPDFSESKQLRHEAPHFEEWRALVRLLVADPLPQRHEALLTDMAYAEAVDLAAVVAGKAILAEFAINSTTAMTAIAAELGTAIANGKKVHSLGFIAMKLLKAASVGNPVPFETAQQALKRAEGAERTAAAEVERRRRQQEAAELRAQMGRVLDADGARALHPDLAEDLPGFSSVVANVARSTGRPRAEVVDAAERVVGDMRQVRPREIHRIRHWSTLTPALLAELEAVNAAVG